MALPSSGTIYMNGRHADNPSYDQGIYIEKVGPPSPNDGTGQANWEAAFGSSSGAYPLRLKELADGTQAGTINLSNLNANKPDTSNPQRMTEFYQYDDTNSVNASPGSFSISRFGQNSNTVTVTHAKYSPWTILNSGMPASWVTITAGSGQSFLGSGSITFNVASNSGSARSTTIVITFTVGTSNGTHYPTVGSDSTTTRTISISQAAGGGGGPGGGGPPPPGGGGGGGEESP